MSDDDKMYAKGYRYKLIFRDGSAEPLYVKSLPFIGPLMRSYAENKFIVETLKEPTMPFDPYIHADADDYADFEKLATPV